jgi:epsilon-lactone hydrolase
MRASASWQARLIGGFIRLRIRRRNWGSNDQEVARRARRLFGTPRGWAEGRSRGLEVSIVQAGSVAAERVSFPGLSDARGLVLYLHGGGYVACSARTYRPITTALARATRLPVIAPDYRRAPEARFPAALDDVCDAYLSLLDRGIPATRIAVAGDSAGGGLVLGLLLRSRERGWSTPACAVTFSPWTDMSGSQPSVRANDGRCAMFRPENVTAFATAYLGSTAPTDPCASPLFADLRGLPPLLVQVGAEELLLDDSRRLVDRIHSAGGEALLEVYPPGVFHCWQMLDGLVPEAGESLRTASAFITRHLHAGGMQRAHGSFTIESGAHPLARGLARLMRLPQPNTAVETRLVIRPVGDRDEWVRDFGGHRLTTRQYRVSDGEFLEQFGILEFHFDNIAANGTFVHRQRAAAFCVGPLRLRIPSMCAPQVSGREQIEGRRHTVTVRVTLPLVGLLLSYHGFVDFEAAGV